MPTRGNIKELKLEKNQKVEQIPLAPGVMTFATAHAQGLYDIGLIDPKHVYDAPEGRVGVVRIQDVLANDKFMNDPEARRWFLIYVFRELGQEEVAGFLREARESYQNKDFPKLTEKDMGYLAQLCHKSRCFIMGAEKLFDPRNVREFGLDRVINPVGQNNYLIEDIAERVDGINEALAQAEPLLS